jgi:hypothetical protein
MTLHAAQGCTSGEAAYSVTDHRFNLSPIPFISPFYFLSHPRYSRADAAVPPPHTDRAAARTGSAAVLSAFGYL